MTAPSRRRAPAAREAPAPGPAIVGNAQGFWGDDPRGPERLARQRPDLGYLTLDYLAEVGGHRGPVRIDAVGILWQVDRAPTVVHLRGVA